MLSPRWSLFWKTLLIVLLVAFCLLHFMPSAPGPTSATVLGAISSEIVPTTLDPRVSSNPQTPKDEAASSLDLSQFIFSTRWGRETRPELSAFSKWIAQYTNASPTQKSGLLARGVALARERRGAFKELIRTHPKSAIAQTVPALIRLQLPASISSLLEERVSGKGDLFVLGRTDAKGVSTIAHRAVIDSREYEAFVYGQRSSQGSHQNISLHGVALDGQLALSDSPLRVFEEGEPVPADKPLAADSCPISRQPTAPTRDGPRPNAVAAESGSHIYWMCHGKHVAAAADQVTAQEIQNPFEAYATAGARSALVMLVDFSDLPGSPFNSTAMDDTMNAVSQFLAQNSYGDLQLSSHLITPVLRMPRTSGVYGDPITGGGDSLLLNDARNAARAAGFNPDAFDFDIVAFADIDFPWSGQGYIGSKGAWIQGNFAGATVSHELGHNLGLWHANSWNSTESSISPEGSHEEYGNPFDVMGRSVAGFPNNHYSANFKRLLGWLSPDNVAVVNGSGTYRVYAHDQNSRLPGRLYGLQIPVGIIAGDETEDYWIDFRQLLTTLYPSTADGAIIQWGNDSGTKSASRLLDMNCESPQKSDAPLSVGKTFNDPDRGLEITPMMKDGSGAAAYMDVKITLVAPPVVELAEALDNGSFNWITSTSAWSGERSVTQDGIDAAASAPIRDNSETFIETTVEGPGALFFWWKVSSEEDFDFLKFIVDDNELAAISGQIDWQKRGYELSPGPHTIRWLYKKDAGTAGGADRGWVDAVSFIVGDHPPFINSQPVAATVSLGELAELHVDVVGSAPLQYQWQKINDLGEPVPVPNATGATFIISNVRNSDAGQYNCVISNSSGTVTSSTAVLTVIHFVSLADAVDNAAIDWSSLGAIGWTGQQAVTHDGNDAAQSGPISNGKDSSLTANITGPGTLTFWWKVSSEADYDLLSLYMDGDLIEQHSGNFDWTQKSLSIPNGSHMIRWTYAKDANLTEGQDAAWVDEVTFVKLGDSAPQFISEPSPQSVSIGGTALFIARYFATEPTTFIWSKDGAVLQPRPGLLGLGTDTLSLTNVQNSDAGIYTLEIVNAYGSKTSSGAALSIVLISLADALNQPKLAFLTGGNADWFSQTITTHDLSAAAKSGSISDNQFTWIETRVFGPATVSFWWKVSSEEDYDFLIFELDTINQLKISGEVDWSQETITLDPGEHTLRWKYRKDRNTPEGDDTGWLDQLEITPILEPQITNVKLNANNITASVRSLPAAGLAILECSTNLTTWKAVSTNQVSGDTMSILRPTTNSAQFLRIRLQ
jgi:hypothetical protein